MNPFSILSLKNSPSLKGDLAQWFHQKWGIPLKAYLESMEECLAAEASVPQWYAALQQGKIIGGLGVIANDFHPRRDLTPNICAVYVEKEHRGRGVAGALLKYACDDMAAKGVTTLYLLTDHTSFYERYGWEFLCMVLGGGEEEPSRVYVHRAEPTSR